MHRFPMVELNSQPKNGFNSLETVKSPMSKLVKCKWSYQYASVVTNVKTTKFNGLGHVILGNFKFVNYEL